MMADQLYCPHCGTENNPQADACFSCGAELVPLIMTPMLDVPHTAPLPQQVRLPLGRLLLLQVNVVLLLAFLALTIINTQAAGKAPVGQTPVVPTSSVSSTLTPITTQVTATKTATPHPSGPVATATVHPTAAPTTRPTASPTPSPTPGSQH